MRAAELQSERDALAAERRGSERDRESLARDRAAFDAERTAFADRAEERLTQSLREFSNELQRRAEATQAARPRVTPAQSALLAKTAEEMRKALGIKDAAATAGADGTFAPNDRVRVRSLRQDATVIEDYGDTVLVAIGPMKTVVKKPDVERALRQAQGDTGRRAGDTRRGAGDTRRGGRSEAGDANVQAAVRTMAELDVRGKRYVEAEPEVDRWVDDALLAGNSPLRLIHGKGTGMLGRGLQEFLRSHPGVKSVRYGNEDEGSGGVTIIELR